MGLEKLNEVYNKQSLPCNDLSNLELFLIITLHGLVLILNKPLETFPKTTIHNGKRHKLFFENIRLFKNI